MARSIITLLEKRQRSSWSLCVDRDLASSLNTSHISLSQIMDREKQLLKGHVILGFSRHGNHLISYQCLIDAHNTYTLHWWWFDLHRPLKHVCSYELFRGEVIHLDLHLLVCQSPDEKYVVVIGCRRLCASDDRRPCYVTILPTPRATQSPPTLTDTFSIHFKFDLLAPFPAFVPSLSLKIPGCVIVNTGDSMVALRYSVCQSVEPPQAEWEGRAFHSFRNRHVFASASQNEALPTWTALSPTHLLPVDAYTDNQPLVDVINTEKCEECVLVTQSSLDVELWLNEALQHGLEARGFTFHSLNDYDLQLVEVCSENGEVVFIVVVLLEASGHSPSVSDCYSVEITAAWNVYTGCARVLRFANLNQAPLSLNPQLGSSQSRWNPAAMLALAVRKKWQLPCSHQHTVRAFSNHTVFTGKSLHSLHHPYLPLSVVLHTTRPTPLHYQTP